MVSGDVYKRQEGYISALCAYGYLEQEDYADGFFPADPMPRAEVVKLLVRALGYEDDGTVTSTVYPDVTEDFYYIAKATEQMCIRDRSNMAFFFIPAGVSIINYFDILASNLIPLLVICLVIKAILLKLLDRGLNRFSQVEKSLHTFIRSMANILPVSYTHLTQAGSVARSYVPFRTGN